MATSVNMVRWWLEQNPGPHGPTEIGLALELPRSQASSGVCLCLKPLVKAGIVRRVTVKGRAAYEVVPKEADTP